MTLALRKSIALVSAFLVAFGSALLIEHQASEHGIGEPACAVCLPSSADGTASAPVILQRVAASVVAHPSLLVAACHGGRTLLPAIRAPPVSHAA